MPPYAHILNLRTHTKKKKFIRIHLSDLFYKAVESKCRISGSTPAWEKLCCPGGSTCWCQPARKTVHRPTQRRPVEPEVTWTASLPQDFRTPKWTLYGSPCPRKTNTKRKDESLARWEKKHWHTKSWLADSHNYEMKSNDDEAKVIVIRDHEI